MKQISLVCIALLSFHLSFAGDARAKEAYYLSQAGVLISLDVGMLKETGKAAVGGTPFAATSCNNHIYFTDLGEDLIYDYDIDTSDLKKQKVQSTASPITKDIYEKEEKTTPKSPLRHVFEKIIRPKKTVKELTPLELPLLVSEHNQKLGLSNIACNHKHIFVSSVLRRKVEVLSQDTLQRVASLNVGERPSGLAVSPNNNYLAVSSTAYNKVFIVNVAESFDKLAEFDVKEGPTGLVWIDDNRVAVLNRGSDSISILDINAKATLIEKKLSVPANALAISKDRKLLYILSGSSRKIITLETDDGYGITLTDISYDMRFPNFLQVINSQQLLVASERDGKVLIFELKNMHPTKRIITNFPPKVFVIPN